MLIYIHPVKLYVLLMIHRNNKKQLQVTYISVTDNLLINCNFLLVNATFNITNIITS